MLGAPAKDDPLVAAIRDRLLTAESVAMAKFNSGAPVEDKPRERQVIFAAVHLAVISGVDGDAALAVFKAQIEASKAAQRAFLKKWAGYPKFAHAPDLARDVRPKLDRLTPIIIAGLRKDRYRTNAALKNGPGDPIYRESWKIAVEPLIKPNFMSGPPKSPPGALSSHS